MKTRLSAWIAAAIGVASLNTIAGCGILPAAVQMPSSELQLGQGPDTKQIQPFAPPVREHVVTKAQMDTQFDAYIGTWRLAENQLILEQNALDAFGFAALVWSAYKTATGHIHDAKWGVAGAGGAALLGNNFKIYNQGLDYRVGAKAMECVKDKVDDIPASFWDGFYDSEGQFAYSDSDALAYTKDKSADDQKQISTLLEALKDNHGAIHNAVREIANRVANNLESTRVNLPTGSDITNAVTQAVKQKTDSAKAADSAVSAAQNGVGGDNGAAGAKKQLDVANDAAIQQFTALGESAAAATDADNQKKAGDAAADAANKQDNSADRATIRGSAGDGVTLDRELVKKFNTNAQAPAGQAQEAYGKAIVSAKIAREKQQVASDQEAKFHAAISALRVKAKGRNGVNEKIDALVAAHNAAVSPGATLPGGAPTEAAQAKVQAAASDVTLALANSMTLSDRLSVQSTHLLTNATNLQADLTACVALIPDNSQ